MQPENASLLARKISLLTREILPVFSPGNFAANQRKSRSYLLLKVAIYAHFREKSLQNPC
jgi:hypothetical protein